MTAYPISEPVRRLVFGDDASPGADVAWLWIVSHAWPGWRADVVTTTLPSLTPPPPEAERTLHPWEPPNPRRATSEAAFAALTHLTAQQDPRLALLTPADLTVIGAHGSGAVKAMHLGSTAEWLVHDPRGPLALVRHGHTTRRALVATDGSAHATRAIGALATLPWVRDVEITVVVAEDGAVDAAAAGAAAADQLVAVGASVALAVRPGRATPVVIAEIERLAPDLVVLGTRGLSGWQRLRLGSTTNAVLRRTGCSLLVANADADA